MSDLVERLRKRADHWKQNKLGWLEYEIYDDAADLIQSQAARIKVLEEALARQCDSMAFVLNHADLHGFYEKFDDELATARQALKTGGEQKDG